LDLKQNQKLEAQNFLTIRLKNFSLLLDKNVTKSIWEKWEAHVERTRKGVSAYKIQIEEPE
jgi:hypothetical protein